MKTTTKNTVKGNSKKGTVKNASKRSAPARNGHGQKRVLSDAELEALTLKVFHSVYDSHDQRRAS